MYTREEVKEMIYNYKWMTNIITSQIYDVDSTSVAQYGIESVMPKAKGQAGDKVFLKVMNRNKAWRRNLKLIEKIEFIDKYEEYITNEMNFHILQMIKLGTKLKTVMDLMEIKSKSTFYGCLNEIVNVYMDAQKGYYD
ncbi:MULTISPECIES: hypothetical protein [Staphylococcus]|uniref:Phage protein n=3 Tax=root TaxID=1 RepID=A0ABX1STG4_STACP|nr:MULTISPECIES: hypothetical protein [Staphylococcus]ASN69992.1 hypothetical protein 7S8_64 [uncultured Caudovirales phage]EHR93267.1 hypothetical protein SEVCU123_1238 [Staphylococcus epidermidis VCU123]ASN69997.1 hypothetical protein 8AX1_3 [uncultured Caudovirales phage]ASN71242.1 hypothetical protein 10F5_45 [uncultured Caudovirales phage]EHQ76083.1 hypothetical protein SEVCU065_1829 [Staphylococcus epidermidis VCU065]